ncbi:hypothetical protein [Variovorax sp. DT-64]|uniref:hypothetical protein n=1 Tax=Variovorax sp. DT-64 TaxID=3396160 RepID=UPI003F1BE3C6
MRTLIFIIAGFVLLAACLGAAKLVSGGAAHATRTAILAFTALWFVVAGANMWVGVAKAGYSVGEELPIFLLIFGLPAVAGVLLKWKVL